MKTAYKGLFVFLTLVAASSLLLNLCVSCSSASLSPAAYSLYSYGVTNREAVAPFFTSAQTQRVDIVGIGDSNQVYQGTGWDHGYPHALSRYFPMYATGLVTQNENQGSGSGLGYGYNRGSSGLFGRYVQAPSPLAILFNTGLTTTPLRPHYYSYLNDTESIASTTLHGLFIDANSVLNISSALQFHFRYGTFSEGNGSFRPSVRLSSPPWSTIAQAGNTNSVTGQLGSMQTTSFNISEGQRTQGLNLRYTVYNGAPLEGPFFGGYMRAENLNRSSGFSSHTLHFGGGYSSRDMAEALTNASDAYLTEFFSNVRALQGPEKKVLIRINTGLNDLNENTPSLYHGLSPGNSPNAYRDNVQLMINRIRSIWVLNGWNQEELYFIIVPSHDVPPSADPNRLLPQYRAIAKSLALTNNHTATVNLQTLANYNSLISQSLYTTSTDFYHLKREGYEYLAEKEIDALLMNF